jgi:hypothetical protein
MKEPEWMSWHREQNPERSLRPEDLMPWEEMTRRLKQIEDYMVGERIEKLEYDVAEQARAVQACAETLQEGAKLLHTQVKVARLQDEQIDALRIYSVDRIDHLRKMVYGLKTQLDALEAVVADIKEDMRIGDDEDQLIHLPTAAEEIEGIYGPVERIDG